MAMQKPSERETTHNGIAHDMNITKTATKMVSGHPELQGYMLLAGGLGLLLFGFGYLPMLKWAVVAAGAMIFLVGLVQSNVIERISNLVARFRNRS